MNSGDLIADRYKIHKSIGQDTYLAENVASGVLWILKSFPNPQQPRLAEMLRRMRHPALPRIFEEISSEGKKYCVLEYIEGETLADLLEQDGGRLEYARACYYMAQVARTLYFLHTQLEEPVLHLDIKPSNILITKEQRCCLLDYGSMHLKGEHRGEDMQHQAQITCTLAYAPPEVLKGDDLCEQSDIFMAGVTLFRLICKRECDYALKIDFGHELNAVPTVIARIIRKCTMSHPGDRYSNASEFAADLENCCETSLSVDASPFEHYHPVALDSDPKTGESAFASGTNKESAKIGEHQWEKPRHPMKDKQIPSNKRKVICVWDQSQFAVELGYSLAKQGKNVLLIDANLLSPEMDQLIRFRDERGVKSAATSPGDGLSDLMEENASNRLNPDTIKRIARKSTVDHLFCVCGIYRMEDYEFYSTEGFVNIIRTACAAYDMVIIGCSRFIFDEFTCVSLICADLVMIPVIANSIQFREFNRYTRFMSGRKHLDLKKLVFIGYDHHPEYDFSYGMCDELCNGRFAGFISESPKRRLMRGSSKPYICVMEKKIEKQYHQLIRRLKIDS